MNNFNLYAKINKETGEVGELIFPDEKTLDLPPAPTQGKPDGFEWFAVKWPVNPWFTGKSAIRTVLQGSWSTREPVTA